MRALPALTPLARHLVMRRLSGRNTPTLVISDATPCGDDKVAIALLAATDRFDIRALVATSGNVWAESVLDTLIALTQRLHMDSVPVLCCPSIRHHERRAHYLAHERSGNRHYYSGAFDLDLPRSAVCSVGGTVAQWLATLMNCTVFLLGPCTALAEALATDVTLKDRIEHLYVMGGCLSVPGNASANAEFNAWFDPEAADAVLTAGLPTTLLTLDAVAGLSYPAALLRLPKTGIKGSGALRQFVCDSPFVCDEVLVAIALSEAVIGGAKMLSLRVDNTRGPSYGRLVVQPERDSDRHAVRVVTQVNTDALWRVVQSAANNGFHKFTKEAGYG